MKKFLIAASLIIGFSFTSNAQTTEKKITATDATQRATVTPRPNASKATKWKP